MTRFFCLFIVFLTPILGLAQGPAQPQLDPSPKLLKPVFNPGKTYRFIAQTSVYMTPPDQDHRLIVMEQQARYDADRRANGEKGVSVRALTERLRVSIRSGEKKLTYDSLKKDNNATSIGRHFESTVNRYVNMELNENLKILSHKEGGRSTSASPLPGLPRFGPDELVQLLNSIPQGYAPDPVAWSDEWVLNGKRSVGDLGDLGFEINYKHVGTVEYEKHKCHAIEFRGQMSGDITDEDKRNVFFQGSKITGSILYDPAIQMTRFSEHNVTMIVNVPSKDDPSNPRAVPMQQKSTMRLLKISDKK